MTITITASTDTAPHQLRLLSSFLLAVAGGPAMRSDILSPVAVAAVLSNDDEPELPLDEVGALRGHIDSRGFPWDERIHASSRALNADGSWRQRRNLNKDMLAKVEAELKSDNVVVPPEPTALVPPHPSEAAPVPPPPEAAPVPPPPPLTFLELMPLLAAKIATGDLTPEKIAGVCQTVGVGALPALAGRPDLVPTVYALLFSV